MTISKEALIKLLGDRPIAYHPMLARALGGVIEAVFVSQLLYWYDRGKLEDNWIWKTQTEWEEETGLTRRNQETARRNLKKMGILKEKRKGVPGKLHFQLNLDKLADLLTMAGSDNVQTVHCEMAGSAIVQCTDQTLHNGATEQCIPETTTENTQETTSERGPAEKTPPAPDYLDHVLEHSQKPAQAGIADPSQDIEAYMEYTDQFVKVFHRLTGYRPPQSQKPKIEQLATRQGADVQLWERVVDGWMGVGWNRKNIDGMIEHYLRGEIPSTGGKSNGKDRSSNYRKGNVPGQPAPSAATGLGDWE